MTTTRFAYVPIGARFYRGSHGTIIFKKADEDWATCGGSRYQFELTDDCRLIDEPTQPTLSTGEAAKPICEHRYGPRVTGGITNCLLCGEPKATGEAYGIAESEQDFIRLNRDEEREDYEQSRMEGAQYLSRPVVPAEPFAYSPESESLIAAVEKLFEGGFIEAGCREQGMWADELEHRIIPLRSALAELQRLRDRR